MLPLMPAGLSFGFVVGAAIAQAGLGIAESLGMSTVVYGASAQLAATVLWAQSAPFLVVIGTALVINARFFIYSASLAPVLEPKSVLERVLYAYLIRDGAYAATVTRAVPDPAIDVRSYYLGACILDWAVWLVSTAAGTLGAAALPASWSLDFVVPLVFVALLVGALDGRTAIEVALIAALAAVVLIPLLPMQTGLLAAIALGLAWGALRGRSPQPAPAPAGAPHAGTPPTGAPEPPTHEPEAML